MLHAAQPIQFFLSGHAVKLWLRTRPIRQRRSKRCSTLRATLRQGLRCEPSPRRRKAGRISFLALWQCNPLKGEANRSLFPCGPLFRLIGWI